MASDENIKVAVRLRPFLECIKEEANGKGKRIVQMDEISSSLSLINPENSLETYNFTFDNILWSFDGYFKQADGYLASDNKAESEEIYCDQKQVYADIGREMVQNLWKGYNSTILTLGETKSGKSWTLLGLGSNKGIVPQAFAELFKDVREKEKPSQQSGLPVEVRLSMAEIYNDRIKDLLPAPSVTANTVKFKNIAKIREHTRRGFYIEGLRSVIVTNHEDIQQRLEEGLANRAVYLTSCNATASNGLTMISVTLVQRFRNHRGDEVTRSATLECFDLPACEFSGHYDTKLEYYTEDASGSSSSLVLRRNGINCLTECVDSLLEASVRSISEQISFDNHNITKLLRNAISGNSRTWVLVALSPSDRSFQRSLYILKLAEKIRMLTTRTAVNEESSSKLVRELKGENEKFKKLISLGGDLEGSEYSYRIERASLQSLSERDSLRRRITDDMKAQIRENEKELRNLQQSLEERWKPFKIEKNDLYKKIENDKKTRCHLFNMSDDSQVTCKIVHIIPLGTVNFGHAQHNNNTNVKGKDGNHFISFCGPGIREHHGTFTYNTKDGKFSIKPAGPNCRIVINDTSVTFDRMLTHNDIIVLGGSQIWVYQNPKETWLEKYSVDRLYFESVMEELAIKSECYQSFNHNALEEAKSITEDLNQNFVLQPLVLQPIDVLLLDTQGDSVGASSNDDVSDANYFNTAEYYDETRKACTISIKVQNTVDGTFWYWSYGKFYDRLEMLKDSYLQFLEDGEVPPLKEIQAFHEISELDLPIGYGIVSLKPLAYLINMESVEISVLDYVSFKAIGVMNLAFHFCDENGMEINDTEMFVENVNELVQQNVTIQLGIKGVQNINNQFKDIYGKYNFLANGEEMTNFLDSKSDNIIGKTNKHEKKYRIWPVTENTLNMMLTQPLVFKFFGKQKGHKLLNLMEPAFNSCAPPCDLSNVRNVNPMDSENTIAQLKIKDKAEQRQRQRLSALKSLIDQSETLGEESIPIHVIRTLVEAKSKKDVDQRIQGHKEFLTAHLEKPEAKPLPPELKALKRFSEICCIV